MLNWGSGLAVGGLVAVSPATVLLLAAALVPTLVARILDGSVDRAAVRGIFICNVAGLLGPLVQLWRAGPPDVSRALALLGQPAVLCSAWIAASAAWLGGEALSAGTRHWLLRRDRRVLRRLDAEIEALEAEWGGES